MKKVLYAYLIFSIGLIFFFGYHYYRSQYDKKMVFVDKSKEESILYFNEICLGSELSNTTKVTRKWENPLNLYIIKDKNYQEQIDFIKQSIEKINEIVSDNFKISISKDSIKANGYLFLCSEEKIKTYSEPFKKNFKNVNENTFGFFSYNFSENIIYKTSIFINTSKPLKFQKSAILEEIVQSLGFGNDSELYPNSVFYQHKYDEKKTIHDFSKLDKKIIQLLYSPEMKVGLNRLETEKIIRKLLEKE